MRSRKNPKTKGGIRGYKKKGGVFVVFVVFVGGGHRASIEKQKGEKVLRSSEVEDELHAGCVQHHWEAERGKSTTKYIGVGGRV